MKFATPYAHVKDACFCPVFIPDEEYQFFINSKYWITDPNFAMFKLKIVDTDNNEIVEIGDISNNPVKKVDYGDSWVLPSQRPYKIYLNFKFPEIPSGYYYLVLYDFSNDTEKCRVEILCEHEAFESSVMVWYRDDYNRSGIEYESLPDDYYNKVRLPASQQDFDNESERETYRKTANDKLTVISSYLDKLHTLQFFKLTEDAFDSISEIFEHKHVFIDYEHATVKTQLASEINPATALLKASVEVYIGQDGFEEGSLYAFGDFVIMCGNATFRPDEYIINANI